MAYLIRKQTQADFQRRIRRVDAAAYRFGGIGGFRAPQDATRSRPLLQMLLGFGWAYVFLAVGNNRAQLEASLAQGALPQEYQTVIIAGFAALLAATFVGLVLHFLRVVFQRGGRRQNSSCLLVGALGAFALTYMPSSVWSGAFDMLDPNAQSLLRSASSTVSDALPGVDWGSVRTVASR